MRPDHPLDTILADIAEAEPTSRAGGDAIRARVKPIFETDEYRGFHRHLISEAFAFAVALGTTQSDPEASYQAAMVAFLDATAMLQMVCRRVTETPAEDAPAALALAAYSTAHHVASNREGLIGQLLNELHPQHMAPSDAA